MAAGASTRFGRPKQLIAYAGQSLLQHSIQVALNSNAATVLLVLGANVSLILDSIETNDTHIVVNNEWQEGMAASIRCGMNYILGINPLIEQLVFMVCDQPFVTSALLNDLLLQHRQTGQPIVVSNYGNTVGIPALFHRSMFPLLSCLQGDKGAKKIIEQNTALVSSVLFPKGVVDIDTPEDYLNLTR